VLPRVRAFVIKYVKVRLVDCAYTHAIRCLNKMAATVAASRKLRWVWDAPWFF